VYVGGAGGGCVGHAPLGEGVYTCGVYMEFLYLWGDEWACAHKGGGGGGPGCGWARAIALMCAWKRP
jgi:hypothetical protein